MEGTVITMPAVALRGLTVFPAMMIHFDINRKRSVAAVEKAMVSDQKVFLVTQRQPEVVEPGLPDLYQVGTIALVKQMVKLPGGNIRVMVEGLKRAELLDLDREDPMLMARIEELEAEIAALTADMHDPAFYQRDAAAIAAHGASLQATQEALDAAYLRWTELDA